jgi:hypothetical protein
LQSKSDSAGFQSSPLPKFFVVLGVRWVTFFYEFRARSRDAFVIGRERNGNSGANMLIQRMPLARDVNDSGIAGQADLDHHIALCKLARLALIHYAYAMSHAFRVPD